MWPGPGGFRGVWRRFRTSASSARHVSFISEDNWSCCQLPDDLLLLFQSALYYIFIAWANAWFRWVYRCSKVLINFLHNNEVGPGLITAFQSGSLTTWFTNPEPNLVFPITNNGPFKIACKSLKTLYYLLPNLGFNIFDNMFNFT